VRKLPFLGAKEMMKEKSKVKLTLAYLLKESRLTRLGRERKKRKG
jgi:hypothetical protein